MRNKTIYLQAARTKWHKFKFPKLPFCFHSDSRGDKVKILVSANGLRADCMRLPLQMPATDHFHLNPYLLEALPHPPTYTLSIHSSPATL